MKYYEQLLKMEVFNLNDVSKLTNSSDAAKQLLIRYVEKGFVKKVRRNLYYCASLENKNSTANRFVIGSYISPTACLSYHTAFEYHGISHQTFYEVYVSSDTVFRNFEFENITYKYIKGYFSKGIVVPEANSKVRVTNVERTVIDSIKNIDLVGGVEELFQCLDSVLILDNDRLFEYLGLYNIQFLYQKAGYIFERYKSDFGIRDSLIAACQKKVGEGIRYFDEDAREGNGTLNKKWNLIIPKGIDNGFNPEVSEFV